MLSKEEIEKAKERLKKFCDYEDNLVLMDNVLYEYQESIDTLLQYIDQLEQSDASKEQSSMYYYNKYKELEQENSKQNKMIDEMSKWIYEKDYNNQEIMLICERNRDYYSNNIEKVKQYFEKKVEKE